MPYFALSVWNWSKVCLSIRVVVLIGSVINGPGSPDSSEIILTLTYIFRVCVSQGTKSVVQLQGCCCSSPDDQEGCRTEKVMFLSHAFTSAGFALGCGSLIPSVFLEQDTVENWTLSNLVWIGNRQTVKHFCNHRSCRVWSQTYPCLKT